MQLQGCVQACVLASEAREVKGDIYGGAALLLTTVVFLLSADVTKLYLMKRLNTWVNELNLYAL